MGRDVVRLTPRQRHARHFRVGLKQEEDWLFCIDAERPGDDRKWWGVGTCFALI